MNPDDEDDFTTITISAESRRLLEDAARGTLAKPVLLPSGRYETRLSADVLTALAKLDPDIDKAIQIATQKRQ